MRRLSTLGIPLGSISTTGLADAGTVGAPGSEAQIRALDAELEARIARLTQMRADLAMALTDNAPADTPHGFTAVAADLSETQRSLLAVYAVVFDEPTQRAFREQLSRHHDTDDELDRLPEDADEATIEDLAQRMVAVTRQAHHDHPELEDPLRSSPLGASTAASVMAHAVTELYNPAQLRVLGRLNELLG